MLDQIGFSSQIDKNSSGLAIMYINSDVEVLYLEGIVEVAEGTVQLELKAPGGEVVYYKTITAPSQTPFDMNFPAKKGNWKLKYSSRRGTGSIDLHLRH